MVLCDTDIFVEALKKNMIEKYSKSHGLHIPDALIASTSICSGMELLTYNVKDFKFIEGIKLYSEESTGKRS